MNKNISLFTLITLANFITLDVKASVGFGSRNDLQEQPTTSITKSEPVTSESLKAFDPPTLQDVDWLKLPYEKAENEILALFQRDIPKLEDLADTLAIYEVKTLGQYPSDYQKTFKSKLERIILTSKKIKVKDCTGCDSSRLVRSENGELRYEAVSTEHGRAAKIASQIGTNHLILADLNYSPEDIRLRIRMLDAPNGNIRWTKEYSTADVVKTREALNDAGMGELGHGDSLNRVIIGEIAFITVLSPGFSMIPTIDGGSGAQTIGLPSFDFLIGERYDRGRKAFGLQVGAIVNTGLSVKSGKILPFAFKVGPQFRHTFNPYNVTTARYSLNTELGGFISPGLATAYAGIGFEMAMINRFSISVMPIYILPTNVADTQTLTQLDDGTFSSSSPSAGKFGGLGFVTKVSINW